MAVEKIVTFHVVMYLKALAASWRHRHWYTGRARHRTSYLGTAAAIPATDLIWTLRDERDFRRFTRLHDDTETLILS